jgi:hypothetical protein
MAQIIWVFAGLWAMMRPNPYVNDIYIGLIEEFLGSIYGGSKAVDVMPDQLRLVVVWN